MTILIHLICTCGWTRWCWAKKPRDRMKFWVGCPWWMLESGQTFSSHERTLVRAVECEDSFGDPMWQSSVMKKKPRLGVHIEYSCLGVVRTFSKKEDKAKPGQSWCFVALEGNGGRCQWFGFWTGSLSGDDNFVAFRGDAFSCAGSYLWTSVAWGDGDTENGFKKEIFWRSRAVSNSRCLERFQGVVKWPFRDLLFERETRGGTVPWQVVRSLCQQSEKSLSVLFIAYASRVLKWMYSSPWH